MVNGNMTNPTGNNKLFWKNSIMCPNTKYPVPLILMVIWNVILPGHWFIWPGIYILENIDIKIFIMMILLYIPSLYYLIRCFFTEPGILTKKLENDDTLTNSYSQSTNSFEISNFSIYDLQNTKEDISALESDKLTQNPVSVTNSEIPRDKEDQIEFYKERYCRTCKIFRPALSSHCNACGNCVKNLDHHC